MRHLLFWNSVVLKYSGVGLKGGFKKRLTWFSTNSYAKSPLVRLGVATRKSGCHKSRIFRRSGDQAAVQRFCFWRRCHSQLGLQALLAGQVLARDGRVISEAVINAHGKAISLFQTGIMRQGLQADLQRLLVFLDLEEQPCQAE